MALSKVRRIGEVTETSKAVATDWFSANLVPNVAQESGELVKWIIQIMVNTATVVTCLVDTGGTTILYKFNSGTACVADTLYTMEIMISNSVTGVNIQHTTTTQLVSVLVGETRDFNSIGGQAIA